MYSSLIQSALASLGLSPMASIPFSQIRFGKRQGHRRTTRFDQHCGPRQSRRYGRQLRLGQIHDHLENRPNTLANMIASVFHPEQVPPSKSWTPHPANDNPIRIGKSRQVLRREAIDGFQPKRLKRPSRVGSGIAVQRALRARPRIGRGPSPHHFVLDVD